MTAEQITLNKSEKYNVYRSECDILLDGRFIGTIEIRYGYTKQNRLRINEYCVSVNKTHVWECLTDSRTISCTDLDTVKQSFKVDGTWETKGSLCPPQVRVFGIPVGFQTFTNEYKTARAAKSAALAFITDVVNVGIFE
jgi:hypothetical protein